MSHAAIEIGSLAQAIQGVGGISIRYDSGQ